jgi:hypothetical protein
MAMVMLAATVASSLLSFKQKQDAGAIAKMEAETGARSEELAAIQREGDRKGRLSQALATQAAGAGASGISAFEGSPLSILQESIKTEETATQRDTFQTRLEALTTRTRGLVSKKQASSSAKIGLIGDVGKAAQIAGTI